jgi:tRNA 2-selenouridine synthase
MTTGPPTEGLTLIVLSGLAGVGKTQVLRALAGIGEPVLDLEALAGHSGSAFGGLGRAPQPTRTSFLAMLSSTARALPRNVPTWIEDEGRFIGSLPVPDWLQAAMACAPEVELVAPEAARISRLVASYGHLEADLFIAATRRIRPRLGKERADAAIGHFMAGDHEAAIAVLLPYFDTAYAHRARQHHRRRLSVIDSSTGTPTRIADELGRAVPRPSIQPDLQRGDHDHGAVVDGPLS